MARWLTRARMDGINLLKRDHDALRTLFQRFDRAPEHSAARRRVAAQALERLKAHALMEEEVFYPALRAEDGVDPSVLDEADEEHHVAKLLVAELESLDPKDERYDAKFTVLAESVRHHMKEEETDMLPKARKMPVDFAALARRMIARRNAAERSGFPPTTEETMVEREEVRAPSIARQRAGELVAAPSR